MGFSGTLYIIEPEESALDAVTKAYQKILKNCKIIPIQKTMEEAIAYLPKKVDAILANHPLDDMILGNSLNHESFSSYFGAKFGTDAERTKFLWGKLEENETLLEKLKSDLVSSWKKLIESTNPRFVAISQYISYYFRKNAILAPDDNALDVLTRIRRLYPKNDDKKIINSIEAYNADMFHWIVLKLK